MLTLHNKNTGEVYEYELKGTGEEPLAEDHIVLNCKARETTKHYFEIKNPSDKVITIYLRYYRFKTTLCGLTCKTL
jgi:hypothetical protein